MAWHLVQIILIRLLCPMYWSYLPFLLNPMIQSYTCAGQWSRHRRRAANICMNIMYPLKTINLSAFFETVTPGWQGGKVLSCYCEDSSLLWRQTILFKFDNLCLLLYRALKICKGMILLPVNILSTIELFFPFSSPTMLIMVPIIFWNTHLTVGYLHTSCCESSNLTTVLL